MNTHETIELALTVISGVCWMFVYIEGITIGLRDRSYAIPFFALALNISWEILQAYYGIRHGIDVQTVFNVIWFALDCGILYTYFRFGRKYFPRQLPAYSFMVWSLLGLITALLVQIAFVR